MVIYHSLKLSSKNALYVVDTGTNLSAENLSTTVKTRIMYGINFLNVRYLFMLKFLTCSLRWRFVISQKKFVRLGSFLASNAIMDYVYVKGAMFCWGKYSGRYKKNSSTLATCCHWILRENQSMPPLENHILEVSLTKTLTINGICRNWYCFVTTKCLWQIIPENS